MPLENAPGKNEMKGSPLGALCLSLTLGLGLLVLALEVSSVAHASGPEEDFGQPDEPAIGLASDALECLAVGDDLPGEAAGVVKLTWSDHAERARLILSVSGAEAEHTVKVNGQPVTKVPIHPDGLPCRDGESFYLDVPLDSLVQGDNLIEITNDALRDDNWTATQVRLEVLGRFTVLPAKVPHRTDPLGAARFAAIDVATYTISFPNPYDGSSQEARVVRPDDYDGSTPVPLVVYLHGRTSDMYEGEGVLASAPRRKGWWLATPELHGSWTGDPQPDPPGKYAYASLESQYDVVGIVNYMLDHYNVDTGRIYLMGNSMGGQIAPVTIAKFPHVFAAAFDAKGPTDMGVWYGEQWEKTWMERECHIYGVPRAPAQNPFCYEQRSGLYFAPNFVHVPISIAHSVDDTLVPVHHSLDLRDAINSYGPDRLVSVLEDTVVGPTCGAPYHCYMPDPDHVLDFFEQFTLDNMPSSINITTDESKEYYWLNLSQTGDAHWSHVEVAYDPPSATVAALITDSRPLTVAFNLGSSAVGLKGATDKLQQPGMGLPATTYLVRGGGVYTVAGYTSGYLTATLERTGHFTLTIAPVEARLSAAPAMVPGWEVSTTTVTAVLGDVLNNPAPDGTAVRFSASAGVFPNMSATYTAAVVGGQVGAILTLAPTDDLAEVTASVGSITASASVDVIHPAIDLLVTPSRATIYPGQTVTYTYQLTNTGDITLTDVTVVNDNGAPGDGNDNLTICEHASLPAGAMEICSYSTILTHATTQTATVTGRDPLGHVVTDSDSTTVVVHAKIYLPVVIRHKGVPEK